MCQFGLCHTLILALGSAAILASSPLFAQTRESSPAIGSTMPSDIDPQSGFRLPLPKREDLDEAGKKTYDRAMTPGASIAGLHGPAGIRLYSTKTSEALTAVNRYLRYEAEALKEGVEPAVIDVIKFRRSTEGLDATDAVVIDLGRQIWRDHKVSSPTFAKAKTLFGPHKLVDLVLLMGTYAGMAALLTAFDMQLKPGQKPLLPIP